MKISQLKYIFINNINKNIFLITVLKCFGHNEFLHLKKIYHDLPIYAKTLFSSGLLHSLYQSVSRIGFTTSINWSRSHAIESQPGT